MSFPKLPFFGTIALKNIARIPLLIVQVKKIVMNSGSQNFNQCLKCHKSLGLLLMSLYFPQIWNQKGLSNSATEMLSSVSLNCQVKKIVMNSGSQVLKSEL